jgi:uncharacterized protein YodC (DUF2158 family)
MLIKKGDIVWLKSGGPKMTVMSIIEENLCHCIWFQYGEIQHFEFETVTLRKSNPFINRDKETKSKTRHNMS